MTDPSRRIAFDILKSVERDGAYSNILLNRKLQRADGVSAGLVRRLVHGVLQDQILLDAQIDRYLRRKNPKLPAKILLRLGFYQLIFCEDIPDFTAVDETVALAKSVMRGGEGFINAVLRSFLRDGKKICLPEDPQKRAEVQYSVPSWIAELWIRSYGPERAESLMKESCGSAPLCLRPNPLKAEGKTSFDLDGGIASSQDYKDGLFSVQDASAQEAVRILAPKPGERVLDVCAAPGGKTCAMAELMENEGFIRACDIHEGKLSLIKKETGTLHHRTLRAGRPPCSSARGTRHLRCRPVRRALQRPGRAAAQAGDQAAACRRRRSCASRTAAADPAERGRGAEKRRQAALQHLHRRPGGK